MDILVPTSMKNAAKCDTQCELQNSASHQIFERSRRWRSLSSMFVSVCLVEFTQLSAVEWFLIKLFSR
jgi:hypothetical protein